MELFRPPRLSSPPHPQRRPALTDRPEEQPPPRAYALHPPRQLRLQAESQPDVREARTAIPATPCRRRSAPAQRDGRVDQPRLLQRGVTHRQRLGREAIHEHVRSACHSGRLHGGARPGDLWDGWTRPEAGEPRAGSQWDWAWKGARRRVRRVGRACKVCSRSVSRSVTVCVRLSLSRCGGTSPPARRTWTSVVGAPKSTWARAGVGQAWVRQAWVRRAWVQQAGHAAEDSQRFSGAGHACCTHAYAAAGLARLRRIKARPFPRASGGSRAPRAARLARRAGGGGGRASERLPCATEREQRRCRRWRRRHGCLPLRRLGRVRRGPQVAKHDVDGPRARRPRAQVDLA